MSKQKVIISNNLATDIAEAVASCPHDKLFLLADTHTRELCLPLINDMACLQHANVICIEPEDTNKNLETLSYVWSKLSQEGATRHSLLINVGGGMVTDLGGFAAATFKRGITYINIPTTLLAMIDASVGGKTGINFNGLKNEIGAFAPAAVVLLCGKFLQTLDQRNLLSGYAEMLKHGLISNAAHWTELLTFDMGQIDYTRLQELAGASVQVKENIVAQDPFEKGIRKALNLGHTIGHAFESFALTRTPVLHGYAVAWGMVCELYLSHLKSGFPKDKLRKTVQFIKENYGTLHFTCDDYPELYEYMKHDKKNTSGVINFTLLSDIGEICINQTATQEEVYEVLDFFRETMN